MLDTLKFNTGQAVTTDVLSYIDQQTALGIKQVCDQYIKYVIDTNDTSTLTDFILNLARLHRLPDIFSDQMTLKALRPLYAHLELNDKRRFLNIIYTNVGINPLFHIITHAILVDALDNHLDMSWDAVSSLDVYYPGARRVSIEDRCEIGLCLYEVHIARGLVELTPMNKMSFYSQTWNILHNEVLKKDPTPDIALKAQCVLLSMYTCLMRDKNIDPRFALIVNDLEILGNTVLGDAGFKMFNSLFANSEPERLYNQYMNYITTQKMIHTAADTLEITF